MGITCISSLIKPKFSTLHRILKFYCVTIKEILPLAFAAKDDNGLINIYYCHKPNISYSVYKKIILDCKDNILMKTVSRYIFRIFYIINQSFYDFNDTKWITYLYNTTVISIFSVISLASCWLVGVPTYYSILITII